MIYLFGTAIGLSFGALIGSIDWARYNRIKDKPHRFKPVDVSKDVAFMERIGWFKLVGVK